MPCPPRPPRLSVDLRMRIISVLGARPQFIKAAPVSRALRATGHGEMIVHTGQHYDHRMSRIFFEELDLPEPDVDLGIGSGPHGHQTGEMLIRLEDVLTDERPDWVLIYGDTNSTLAGALVAAKLHLRLAHVEAGLRSFNREMPEEINRVVADHCADLLFCPTRTAVRNLEREGIVETVELVGDTMYDGVLHHAELARRRSSILQELELTSERYLLVTLHRPYNTDVAEHLRTIMYGLMALDEPVVFPVHPRTRAQLEQLPPDARPGSASALRLIEPVGYLDMLELERNARMVLTDSGGVQKEAYFFGVPCITLRPETEWVETVESGWNVVAGEDRSRIPELVGRDWRPREPRDAFGDGNAAGRIVRILAERGAQ